MNNVNIAATEQTREVALDFSSNVFTFKGESYPDNATEFYTPLQAKIKEHLAGLVGQSAELHFELIYFNSSSDNIILGLFNLMEETASAGNDVTIFWTCDEGEDIQTAGEEFAGDLKVAKFQLKFRGRS